MHPNPHKTTYVQILTTEYMYKFSQKNNVQILTKQYMYKSLQNNIAAQILTKQIFAKQYACINPHETVLYINPLKTHAYLSSQTIADVHNLTKQCSCQILTKQYRRTSLLKTVRVHILTNQCSYRNTHKTQYKITVHILTKH